MRRLVGGLLLVVAAGGCTSVKMVQRDGCWVRRTEKVFGRVVEEVGPCARPAPQWALDRLTRLVQECVAQADWRLQSRALEVWSRRLPYPTPQPRQDEVLRECMDEAKAGMATETEAAELRTRLSELAGERDALRTDVAKDWTALQESHAKLADWLGQAAQKPPGNATASATSSATSDGKASNDSGTTLAAESGANAPPGGAPVSNASVVLPASPAAQPGTAAAPAPAQETKPAAAQEPQPATAKRPRARARRVVQEARTSAPGSCPAPAAGTAPCATAGPTAP